MGNKGNRTEANNCRRRNRGDLIFFKKGDQEHKQSKYIHSDVLECRQCWCRSRGVRDLMAAVQLCSSLVASWPWHSVPGALNAV